MSRTGEATAAASPCIVVIGLVPAEDFTRFLREVRQRYPEATLTAVVGAPELQAPAREGAEECLLWSDFPARALVEELRRRQPMLVAVPYNPEYAASRTYWKALALATLSRSKGVLFCEGARLPEGATTLRRLGRPTTHIAAVVSALVRGPVYRLGRLLEDLGLVVLCSPLVLVLLGIMLVDVARKAVGLVSRRERKRARPW